MSINTCPVASLGNLIVTVTLSPASTSSISTSIGAVALDTVILSVVWLGKYLSSPEYSTEIVLFPAVKSLMLNTALPSLISAVYFSPSISTVTVPVASLGTSTVTTAVSPTVMSLTIALIGASSFGLVAFEVIVAPSKLSSPE